MCLLGKLSNTIHLRVYTVFKYLPYFIWAIAHTVFWHLDKSRPPHLQGYKLKRKKIWKILTRCDVLRFFQLISCKRLIMTWDALDQCVSFIFDWTYITRNAFMCIACYKNGRLRKCLMLYRLVLVTNVQNNIHWLCNVAFA